MDFAIERMEDVCAPVSAYTVGYYCGKASKVVLAIIAIAVCL